VRFRGGLRVVERVTGLDRGQHFLNDRRMTATQQPRR
jgi:hypothetical protein